MKAFFSFLFQFLFIDQDTKKISTTQFWRNVGLGINCAMFPCAVMFGTKAEFDLWLAFGAIVVGSHGVSQFVKVKALAAESSDTTKN